MTVIALTSTRGAPGVTTAALALTFAWPRAALFVEADVSGSSSVNAGHLRGQADPEPNIVDLAVAYRNNALTFDALHRAAQELPLDSSRIFLAGLANSSQRSAFTPAFWEALSALLTTMPNHGIDVIIDAGRHGMRAAPEPLLQGADLVCVVTRTRLDPIVSVTANAAEIRGAADVATDRVGVIVVGDGQPYSARDVARTSGLPVWATMSWDPVNADRLSGGKDIASRARFDKSPLMRSARSAVNELTNVANRRERVLGTEMGRP
ncbi:hypothetical protein G1H11_16215 [Phytoactinopolyspora alkaliphila]|uniref:CpsD/CapB family tyrosine-protein kinase n=1 Tax=Phytoactinopolyspora alkaliphila TaxID=1783498 RepID=A0A6N9YPE5_9ACTN|nr:hypothetical protein [Phytoactinopolyspora alkaliphila]NED96852.1 hypothetical protein [Phytoactinopolyspora alkaliphila]